MNIQVPMLIPPFSSNVVTCNVVLNVTYASYVSHYFNN
jgi:hypothetical protein